MSIGGGRQGRIVGGCVLFLICLPWVVLGGEPLGNSEGLDKSLHPTDGEWAVAAGAFYLNFNAELGEETFHAVDAGGAFLAAQHFFARPFALELAVRATPQVSVGLLRLKRIFASTDELRADVDLQAFHTTLAGKLYPLRFAKEGLGRWRFQPFVTAGAGVLLVNMHLGGHIAIYRMSPGCRLT